MELSTLSDEQRKEYAEYIKRVPPYPSWEITGFFVLDGPRERQIATWCHEQLQKDCAARGVPFDYEVAPYLPGDFDE